MSKTLELKVKEILNDNNIAYDSIKVNISGNAGFNGNESLAVSSVVINAKNMKKRILKISDIKYQMKQE